VISASTAVAPSLGKRCPLLLPTAETESMNMFVQEVSRTFSHSVLIMQGDGAGWHHAKERIIPEKSRLMTQPPYSPELNPVEHMWDESRETYFHNRVFQSMDDIRERLCEACNALEDDPDRMTSLTFFPHLRVTV
jgi:hypothetical protein